MKKKYNLFFWHGGIQKFYYLKHPLQFFKDCYWNIRNFFHRGKYGFAYSDVWSFDGWFMTIIPAMLRYLKTYGSGFPGVEPYTNRETWEERLEYLASELESGLEQVKNEYEGEFRDFMEKKVKSGSEEETFQEKIVKRKYFDRELELENQKTERLVKAMTELGKNMNFLWD